MLDETGMMSNPEQRYDAGIWDVTSLRPLLQAEYDGHFQKYLRGCSSYIVGCWAIEKLAQKMRVKIITQEAAKMRDSA